MKGKHINDSDKNNYINIQISKVNILITTIQVQYNYKVYKYSHMKGKQINDNNKKKIV